MPRLSPDDKLLIYHLSGDLSDSPTPFADLARQLGRTEEELLERLRSFQADELIRRFGAILWHQRSGFAANAMLVFKVDPERTEQAGQALAALPYVSHCYQRKTVPGWPFNLYAMAHAENGRALEDMIEEMRTLCGAEDWRKLESLRELKKASLRYFRTAQETTA